MAKEKCADIKVRNVPQKLLEDFDATAKDVYPSGRSEAIRDLMRKFARENKEG